MALEIINGKVVCMAMYKGLGQYYKTQVPAYYTRIRKTVGESFYSMGIMMMMAFPVGFFKSKVML